MKAAVLFFAAAVSACATRARLDAPSVPLHLLRSSAPAIGAAASDVDVSRAGFRPAYAEKMRQAFFTTLVSTSESDGLVAEAPQRPLRLSVQLNFWGPQISPAERRLTPLAMYSADWIESTVRYAVKLVVVDSDGRVVYRRLIEDHVSGRFKGARPAADFDSYFALLNAAAESAARRVLRDLDARGAALAPSRPDEARVDPAANIDEGPW